MRPKMYTHDQLIDGVIITQIVTVFCYLISSFVNATNRYAGFVGIITGVIYGVFTWITHYGLRRNITRTLFGVILGGVVMLAFISLEGSIFWGQYGQCKASNYVYPTLKPTYAPTFAPIATTRSLGSYFNFEGFLDFTHVSRHLMEEEEASHVSRMLTIGVECSHGGAMKSMCAFSVFMFLTYLAVIGIMLKFKNEILGSGQLNEGYAAVPSTSGGDDALSRPKFPQSADF